MNIVGIAGLPRSGKDTVAELFIKEGYFGISFGDVVRGYAFERHKDQSDPISVTNMTETSNWLREKYGPDVILNEALKQYENEQKADGKYKGLVLWSVRAPVEVDWILQHNGDLIWVESSDEVRHARSIKHIRHGEIPLTLTEFKQQESLQWVPQPGVDEKSQMNISYVKQNATKTIDNNGDDVAEFLEKVHKQIISIKED